MHKLMVVDDDHAMRSMLHTALTLEGYEVRGAGDGDEALRLVDRERPEAILTDLIMPGTDGLALCKAIRARPDGENISIIALTGGDYPTELTGYCDVFLRKPVDIPRLVDTLQQLEASRLINSAPVAAQSLRW